MSVHAVLTSDEVHRDAYSLNFTGTDHPITIIPITLLLRCCSVHTNMWRVRKRCPLLFANPQSAERLNGMKVLVDCHVVVTAFSLHVLLTGLVPYSICSLDPCFALLLPIVLVEQIYGGARVI